MTVVNVLSVGVCVFDGVFDGAEWEREQLELLLYCGSVCVFVPDGLSMSFECSTEYDLRG